MNPLTLAFPPIVKVVLRNVAFAGKKRVGVLSLLVVPDETGVDSNLPLPPELTKVKSPLKPLALVLNVSLAVTGQLPPLTVHVGV